MSRQLLVLALAAAALALGALAAWLAGGFERELVIEPFGPIETRIETPDLATPLAATDTVDASAPESQREPAVAPVQPAQPSPGTNRSTGATVLFLHVTATGGRGAVASAKVSLTPAPGAKTALALDELSDETSSDGRASLRVEPGVDWTLRVTGPSDAFAPSTVAVQALAPGELRSVEVEVDARDDLLVRGRVLALESGLPVEGAEIRLRAPSAAQRDLSFAAVAGAVDELDDEPAATSRRDGGFEVRARSWQTRHLRIDAPGRAPALVGLGTAGNGARVGEPGFFDEVEAAPTAGRDVEVDLARSAALSIAFERGPSLPEDGALDARCAARAWDLARGRGDLYGWIAWSAPLDADGRATIPGLPPDVPLIVEIARGGDVVWRSSEDLVLDPGEQRALAVATPREALVQGRVIDQRGEPVGGVRVERRRLGHAGAAGRRTSIGDTTTPEGVFSFPGVPFGTWRFVAVSRPDQREGPPRDRITSESLVVEVDEPREELTLEVVRGVVISGTVVGPDGLPSGRAAVEATPVGGGRAVLEQSDENGVFAVGPLREGRYRLVAAPRGTGASAAPSEPLEVEAGSTGVALRLAVGAQVHVRVAGAPAGWDGRVLLSRRSPEGCWQTLHASGDERGAWFLHVPPGTWVPTVLGEGYAWGLGPELTVAAGETREIELALQPAALVRLRRVGGRGEWTLRLVARGATWDEIELEPNRSEGVAVPPGEVVVERLAEQPCGWVEVARFEAALGDAREVVIGREGR